MKNNITTFISFQLGMIVTALINYFMPDAPTWTFVFPTIIVALAFVIAFIAGFLKGFRKH